MLLPLTWMARGGPWLYPTCPRVYSHGTLALMLCKGAHMATQLLHHRVTIGISILQDER